MATLNRICLVCKQPFYSRPSAVKRGKGKYCSRGCSSKALSQNWSGKNSPSWKGGLIERNCLTCGVLFRARPSEIERGRGNCCSKKCAAKIHAQTGKNSHFWKGGKSELFERTCLTCGCLFMARRGEIEKGWGKYCSHACASHTLYPSGQANPNFKHGKSKTNEYLMPYNRTRVARLKGAKGKHDWRDIQALYDKQGGECAICKKGVEDNYHVDHIMPLALGGSNWPDNLQLLCPRCNLKKHDRHPLEFLVSRGILT